MACPSLGKLKAIDLYIAGYKIWRLVAPSLTIGSLDSEALKNTLRHSTTKNAEEPKKVDSIFYL